MSLGLIALVAMMGSSSQDLEAIRACTAVRDDSVRLACFDAAVEAITTARPAITATSPTPRPAPMLKDVETAAPSIAPTAAQQPSITAPSPQQQAAEFGLTRKKDKEVESISGKVIDVVFTPYDKIRITLDNGQVWQQLDSDSTRVRARVLRKEQTATVKKAAMGSFKMTLEPAGKTVRVRRRK